jgi:tetratricopeptide (TPR) repeat protein
LGRRASAGWKRAKQMFRVVLQWALVLCLGASSAVITGCNQERNESIRLMNQGLQAFKHERLTDALGLLAQASDVDPTNDRAYFYQGLLYEQKLENFGRAEENYRRAIELNGGSAEYHYHLGATLAKQEKWKEAVASIEKSLELEPERAEAHLRLGMALERLEKFDRAQEVYMQAIRSDPRLPETYNALGNLYRRFEQYSHAAQVFKNGIENNPVWPMNYHDLGLVYQAQRRFDDAIAQYEKARELDPDHGGTLFNLGMAFYAAGDGAQAMNYLKMYLARRTSNEDPLRIEAAQDTLFRLEEAAKQQP